VNRIGIMQGRLSPPVGDRIQAFPSASWREEFPRAAAAGLHSIEWIYDVDENPLDVDPSAIGRAGDESGVAVCSICADYFMTERLVDTPAAEVRLRELLDRAVGIGVHDIVLPFVDASSLGSDNEVEAAVEIVARAASYAPVTLHLETDLPPEEFARLLARLPSEQVQANYDMGNSASLGYDPGSELAAFGSRIGSVHVKDRVRGGGTVPLGSGDVDFERCFRLLDELGYAGSYILQAAREDMDEVELAVRNRLFVESHLAPVV
jgi:hexulose-6-phosphate isomerase